MTTSTQIELLEFATIDDRATVEFESSLATLRGLRANITGLTSFGLVAFAPLRIEHELSNTILVAKARIGAVRFDVAGVVSGQELCANGTSIWITFNSSGNVQRIADERLTTRWTTRDAIPPFGYFPNPLTYGESAYFSVGDISLSGLRFQTSLRNKFLVKGQQHSCTIAFPFIGDLRTTICIRAVDLIERDLGPLLSVGAEFTDISDRHIDLISQYLTTYSSAPLHGLASEGLLASTLKGLVQFVEVDPQAGDPDDSIPSGREIIGQLLTETVVRAHVKCVAEGSSDAISLHARISIESRAKRIDVLQDTVAYLGICALKHSANLLAVRAKGFDDDLHALGFRESMSQSGEEPTWEICVPRAIAGKGIGLQSWATFWRHLPNADPARLAPAKVRLSHARRLLLPLAEAAERLRKAFRPTSVAWDHYALHYDKMCKISPAYQANVDLVRRWACGLGGERHTSVYEFGAGTGNLSQEVARLNPASDVVHVDQDLAMNLVARQKYRRAGLHNVRILTKRLEELEVEHSSADAVLCVHTLYSLESPVDVLERIFGWMRPGGHFLVIDIGRPIRLTPWALYLFRHSVAQTGLFSTLKLFVEGQQVARQNRNIAAKQNSGEYWAHDLPSFETVLQRIGFKILESGECYRGISDYAFCRKPPVD